MEVKPSPNIQPTMNEVQDPLHDPALARLSAPGPQQQTPTAEDASRAKVGSDEWHQQRRSNHKEVERRRREAINEGINDLGQLVPNCEKNNKGSILTNAVRYIIELKQNEERVSERWRYEKMLFEQIRNDLHQQNSLLKTENDRLKREISIWRHAASDAVVNQDESGNATDPQTAASKTPIESTNGSTSKETRQEAGRASKRRKS